jgi:hypothetical protein
MIDLDAIKRRLEAATAEGPWEYEHDPESTVGTIHAVKGGGTVAFVPPFAYMRTVTKTGQYYCHDTAAFIAAAPADIAALIAEVERLRALVAQIAAPVSGNVGSVSPVSGNAEEA